MTGTNHGMTGALIAILVKEPLIAVPLSFLSHFACDAVPHFGFGTHTRFFDRTFNTMLISDFLIAVGAMFTLGIYFPTHKWVIWSCMVAAASPDLMWAYYNLYIEKIRARRPSYGPFARFHQRIQWSETPKGWFVEIAWFITIATLILSRR